MNFAKSGGPRNIYALASCQVAAFFFVKDVDDIYNVRRNFMPQTYDFEENVTFRGEEWAALITTWI